MSRSRIIHIQDMEHPQRPNSAAEVTTSRFLVRTSNFLKKVSQFTNGRKKSTNDSNSSSSQDTATFAARSMALGRKSFGFSQPILGVQTSEVPHRRRMSEHDDSSEGDSTSSPRSSNAARRSSLTRTSLGPSSPPNGSASTNVSTSLPVTPPSPQTTSTHLHPVLDGLPRSSSEPPWLPSPPPGDPPPGRTTSLSSTPNPLLVVPQDTLQSPPSRSSSLPPSPSGNALPSVAPGESTSSTPQLRFSRTPELSREQRFHIRLASLPPPMMARYNTQGSARLTPNIVPRQPPMPIQNLPTLPPSTPVLNPSAPSRAHVRSIPALPLTGPRDDNNADMDDEGSDSSDDGMEDDERGGRDDISEEDDGEDSPGLPPGPIMSRRREALPQVDTSSLDISYSFSSSLSASSSSVAPGAGTAQHQRGSQRPSPHPWTPSADLLSTPQPEHHDVHTDYFSSKTRQPDSGIEEVSRTPRPTDHTPAVPLAVAPSKIVTSTLLNGSSGPGMIPKIVPMPPTPISPALSHRTPRFTHSPSPSGADPSSRPSLYHHGSRSMVDLISYQRTEKEKEEAADKRTSRAIRPSAGDSPSSSDKFVGAALAPAPTLRRQRSLPTYRPASLPPPYPEFFPGRNTFIIQPREEEGREDLPSYTNSIYLCTMMPRKLEFTAPGVQAKERKWRRVVVELDGTIMRVYRCHSAGGAGKVGEWWERRVGVGDWSSGPSPSGTAASGGTRDNGTANGTRDRRGAGPNAGGETADVVAGERRGKGEEENVVAQRDPSTSIRPQPRHQHTTSKSKLHLVASSLLHPTRSSQDSSSSSQLGVSASSPTRSRLSFDTSRETERSSSVLGMGRRSVDALQRRGSITRSSNSDAAASPSTSPTGRSVTSPSTWSSSPTVSTSTSSRRSRSRDPSASHSIKSAESGQAATTAVLESKDIIKSYTLQHAESGLASDYVKRRNVIRVRMEGEQFLLQAKDVAGVVDWIEGIQAATNVALDLDERPMPKGPMFPRRRRRRQRRPDGTIAPATQAREAESLRANAPPSNTS